MTDHEVKEHLTQLIFERLSSVAGVLSVTLVGSFVDREDLSGISDIDTIVVCDRLNKKVFDHCLAAVHGISFKELDIDNFQLKINSSFGPLKFDQPNLVVLHLMIYDLEGHKRHVTASPFTCFDWERSKHIRGKSLKELFPVGKLQPRDFLEARRGMENYLEDLKLGSISIREYTFEEDIVSEQEKTHPLDARHQGEYAFHIVRNLVLNEIKLKYSLNRLYSISELQDEIQELLGDLGGQYITKFKQLADLKEQRSTEFPDWTLEWAQEFIKVFQHAFSHKWQSASTVYFLRHAQTSLNDGTFLGQGRNPGIIKDSVEFHSDLPVKNLYTSPAQRCLETAGFLFPEAQSIPDDRLLELNYGSAEGLTYSQLRERHPGIIRAWSNGYDPHFPAGGENTAGVLGRLQSFLSENILEKPVSTTAVVSHNVVLRCLLGEAFAIPQRLWHELVIPHAKPLEFKMLNGRLYPNLPRTLVSEIFVGLSVVR